MWNCGKGLGNTWQVFPYQTHSNSHSKYKSVGDGYMKVESPCQELTRDELLDPFMVVGCSGGWTTVVT